ncbi:MAG: GGDEF domain-containing protein [Acidobacteria bacterium]|jgi:diguanylate cyclase (GGDEF)-like protein|nr:GGDEF domain-containing protein [Acidobacteriota bacterium]
MEKKAAVQASGIQHPDALALRHMLEKNLWLIRIRWIYPAFIMAFFLAYRFLARHSLIRPMDALLVFLLPVIVNFLFWLNVRRREKAAESPDGYGELALLASRQLDLDLLVIALTVYFSGGLASPIVALMVVYNMISTFLVDTHRALRNTLASMALLLAIALLQEGGRFFSGTQVTSLLAYYFMFIFTYFVAGYLSHNLHRNEELLKEVLQQTRELSITDGLTGLYNQMHFFELLDRETRKSQRHDMSYALIIFDVDHFKNFNDSNGHLRGSQTLKDIATVMKKKFRSTDLLAKYGGDEFVIILPQTDKVGAYLAAERLREGVEKQAFPGAETQPLKKLTISIGLASFPEHGLSDEEILNHADKALYFAKESGRNRSVIYHENIEKEIEEFN